MAPDVQRHPSGGPLDLKPHLVVKLKDAWGFDAARCIFLTATGKKFSPREDLPKQSRIVFMTPDLAKRRPETLSKEERNLAQYLQVILPKGTDAAAYIPVVNRWECVEEVKLPPEISLP